MGIIGCEERSLFLYSLMQKRCFDSKHDNMLKSLSSFIIITNFSPSNDNNSIAEKSLC